MHIDVHNDGLGRGEQSVNDVRDDEMRVNFQRRGGLYSCKTQGSREERGL